MPRGTTSRRWFKLYPRGMLHGSINYQLSEPEQAVWVKLLCIAAECDRDGQISDNDGRPFPNDHIAHELHTTLDLLESTLEKCKDEGRIVEDEHGLHIVNWKIYQSEYERQKPYREAKAGQKPARVQQEADTVPIPRTAEEKAKAEASRKRIADGIKKLANEKKL